MFAIYLFFLNDKNYTHTTKTIRLNAKKPI